MNEYMKAAMDGFWRMRYADYQAEDVKAINADFREGFEACYDLLMPLLQRAATHVIASHGAEHMMDGFRPQKRPIDGLVKQIKRVTE